MRARLGSQRMRARQSGSGCSTVSRRSAETNSADLAVTATFTTFNASHQLRTPSGLPSYLAYFTAIVAMWTVQVHYDIRFQGNDMVHRLAKAAQVVLYIYMAAASGGWDLSKLAPPKSGSTSDLISHRAFEQWAGLTQNWHLSRFLQSRSCSLRIAVYSPASTAW